MFNPIVLLLLSALVEASKGSDRLTNDSRWFQGRSSRLCETFNVSSLLLRRPQGTIVCPARPLDGLDATRQTSARSIKIYRNIQWIQRSYDTYSNLCNSTEGMSIFPFSFVISHFDQLWPTICVEHWVNQQIIWTTTDLHSLRSGLEQKL